MSNNYKPSSIMRSVLSLVKTNGGKFKSIEQQTFLLDKQKEMRGQIEGYGVIKGKPYELVATLDEKGVNKVLSKNNPTKIIWSRPIKKLSKNQQLYQSQRKDKIYQDLYNELKYLQIVNPTDEKIQYLQKELLKRTNELKGELKEEMSILKKAVEQITTQMESLRHVDDIGLITMDLVRDNDGFFNNNEQLYHFINWGDNDNKIKWLRGDKKWEQIFDEKGIISVAYLKNGKKSEYWEREEGYVYNF